MMTKEQVRAALEVTRAVAEAIRDLGEVPSGHLYARLLGTLSLEQYEAIIGVLKRTRLVEEDSSHVLRWIGPPPPAPQGTGPDSGDARA
jgi:hypothetical protein